MKNISKLKTAAFVFCFGLLSIHLQANQQVMQEVLDGDSIPKFVEPLTTFNGRRVDGTKALEVTAKEFQQRVLPSSFYKKLSSSVTYKSVETGKPIFTINPKNGTYLWGF